MKKEIKKSIKPLIIIVSLVIALALAVSMIIFYELKTQVKDFEIVATVNGYNIYAKELAQRMSDEKGYIIEEFENNYDGEIDEKFWNEEINGKKPIEELRNRALEKLVRYKVEQKIAVDNGVIEKREADYKAFLQNLEKENNERSLKIAKGQPVYGVKSYTESSYFKYTYSNMQIENRKVLSEKGKDLYADESTLKKWYESVKRDKYLKADTYQFDNYYLYFNDNKSGENYSQEQAEMIMKKVKAALEDGKDLQYINKNICNDVVFKYIDVNDENISNIQKSSPTFFEEISTLNKSDVSKVITENDSCYVAVCKSRKPGGYKEFSEYKNSMYSEYIEEKYEAYVDEKVKNAKVNTLEKFNYVELN